MSEEDNKTGVEPIEVPDPKHLVETTAPSGERVKVPASAHKGDEPPRRLTAADFVSENRTRINELHIIEASRELKVEPEVLMAFTKVEAPKGPFLPTGQPTILFEAHVFSRNTRPKHKYDETHPTISSRTWNRTLYGKGGLNQYARLERAMFLDQRAALMACSWGSWQVLGENYEQLGFNTVEEMVHYCVASEVNQFDVFLRFVKTKRGLLRALQDKDWDEIAALYNGAQAHVHDYAGRFEAEYNRLKSDELRRGSQGPKVVTLQKLLNKHGANPPVKVDGWFGVSTDAAVRDLQARWGLVIDGVVGAQTYERMASERIPDESYSTSKRVGGAVLTTGIGVSTIAEGARQLGKTVEAAKEVATLERLRELQTTTEVTKEVVSTAKDAAQKVVGAQEGAALTIIIVGVVILGIAGFFAWTKYYDNKKKQGV